MNPEPPDILENCKEFKEMDSDTKTVFKWQVKTSNGTGEWMWDGFVILLPEFTCQLGAH